ncbi:4-phytase [Beutenbergia cavernae DSM 12333]|uniref:4-phytase n=1 Tax=Beutenbergia cavernae (strain ATCC BAA-8 / DSM 12333 / CCUG 43141 / JCM 11478 / NBRC 16432 / NCIMB 13614 / HKI 0122) TaxID=471853 RepID=C5C3J0_BEUC1|nr:ABC transporter substrate-binding protein [Beutenbergia cavernae]ACQ81899.1 4-phytase [Beutenbergia cavernae DSM 12333]
MRHRLVPLAATIAALALLATACSSGGGTGDDDGAASGEPTSFSIAISEPDHLVPGNQYVSYEVVTSVWSSLTTIDPDSAEGWVPLVAESVTSDDNVTWTVTLADGWTFHDGTPVTAQSYVDAWNYTAYGPHAQVNGGQLARVAGYDELNPAEGEPTTETLSGLAVVDERTFTVTLVGPDSQFPLQLSDAQTALFPLPESFYDDPEAFDRMPIGNGPYAMTEPWVDNEPIVLEAYADFPGEAPLSDRVELKPYLDMNTAYTDVQAGNTDIVFVPASRIGQVEADFGDRVRSYPSPGISTLGFPLEDPRFADPRVRQAISMAVDRQALSDAIYGGYYTPASAVTPEAMIGSPTGLCDFCDFDPDAARDLLAEAGGWEGPMVVEFPGGSGLDELYEAIANQIRQNLEIDDVTAQPTTDWAEWSAKVEAWEVTGPHFARWGALYPSMQDTLRNMYTSAGGCYNCTQYSSPEVDDLLTQADAAPSNEEATELYIAAQREILSDFPTAPLFNDAYTFALSEHIEEVDAISGSIVLSRVSVHE